MIKNNIINLYLAKKFIIYILYSFLAFSFLYLIGSVMDQAINAKDLEGNTKILPVAIGALRVPFIIYQSSYFIFLVGSLVFFSILSNRSELTVIRNSGMSALSIIKIPTIIAFLLGIFVIVIFNPFSAKSSQYSQELLKIASGENDDQQILQISASGIWLRERGDDYIALINAKTYDEKNETLENVNIYEFDENLFPSIVIKSNKVKFATGRLILYDVLVKEKPEEESKFYEIYEITSELTPNALREKAKDKALLSIWELNSYIKAIDQAGLNPRSYQFYFHELLTTPLKYICMVLIGAVLTFKNARSRNNFKMVVYTLSLGFLLYFTFEISSSIAEFGIVRPFIPAWLSVIALLLICVTVFMRIDLVKS